MSGLLSIRGLIKTYSRHIVNKSSECLFFNFIRLITKIQDTAQKMKFSIKDFFSKFGQICRFNEFMITQSSLVLDLHNPIAEAYPSSTVLEGDRMMLSCLTESTMPINYYWMKNDANITEAASSQLVINSTGKGDIGIYKCGVFNGLGYNTSAELNVTILCK